MSKKKLKGFTLVELLVVIAIIALLVAIVFPAISSALLRGRVSATAVIGRNIHNAIVGAQLADIYVAQSTPFPDSTDPARTFADSTAYFRFMVENRYLNVAPSFFAPPGIVAAQQLQNFTSANNGWCIVNDSENLPETAPLLFTRNLNLATLVAPGMPEALTGQPFLDKAMAFVTRGGAAFSLLGDDIRDQERFDGLFVVADPVENTPLGNPILRP